MLFFARPAAGHLQPEDAFPESPWTAELFEISRRARLVQSFEADPAAPVPKLWQQRLSSSEAPDRWARHGRGT